MKIVEITWVDAAEHKDQTFSKEDDDPLVILKSVGYFVGNFIDKNGNKYIKLCYKISTNSEENDDFIVIPRGCIKSVKIIKKF